MQEPANETTPQPKAENPYLRYELVTDPTRLRELIDNTFTDVIIQTLSEANGKAELAGVDLPRFKTQREKNVAGAHEAIQQTIKQVQELQQVLRQPHNQIGVDTRYGPGRHFINLSTARKDPLPKVSEQVQQSPSKPATPTK